MNLTFWELGEVLNAQNDYQLWPDFAIGGIEFDTRKIQLKDLFVPLQGTRDGHDFFAAAKDQGACATLWSREVEVPSLPYLQVENTLLAFQTIAKYYLEKIHPQVIAITGSNGKTTTKDMTHAVLAKQYRTYKTQGNYNNNIGLPYTILHMPSDTEMLVLEMGMDHKGEIEFLSKLAQPDIAAITMIGESHIEHLGSRAGIASAKMEIAEGLKASGLLVVPANEPLLVDLIARVSQNVISFGLKDADTTAKIIEKEQAYTTFTCELYPEAVFKIPVLGEHNVTNALIALIIAKHFEVTEDNAIVGLGTLMLTQNRTQWINTETGLEILSDVYNANPTAMKLVLENFSNIQTSKRKIIVLGDMLDLGEDSQKYHMELAKFINPSQIDTVILYGSAMKDLYYELQVKYSVNKLRHFAKEQKMELEQYVKNQVDSSTMVFLKASNGMGLSQIVEAIS